MTLMIPDPARTERARGAPAPRLLALRSLAAVSGALLLAACGGGDEARESAPPTTPAPAAQPPAVSAPAVSIPTGQADSRGVIVYDGYSAVVARSGDTVQSMAQRVGVSPSELAAYNGLPTSYLPSPGDELVLPPRAGGYSAAASVPQATAQVDTYGSPLSSAPAAATAAGAGAVAAAGASAAPASGVSSSTWDPARIGAAIDGSPASASAPAPGGGGPNDVAYHDVAANETVYSIARRYGVQAETLIAWNALSGPSYSVSPGQVLVIPGAGSRTAGVTESLTPPGGSGVAVPPPSAGAPLPPDTVPPTPLASPQLNQYQTPQPALSDTPTPVPETSLSDAGAAAPAAAAGAAAAGGAAIAASGASDAATDIASAAPVSVTPAATPASVPSSAGSGRLMRPVPGSVIKPYNPGSGGSRNDGIDLAASPGEPVRASADGTVALVSTSLGEWGNIVLVRHDDQLMTVYGRMGVITVNKGDAVRAGEVLGDVAAASTGASSLHFEVRRGANSQDPEKFF